MGKFQPCGNQVGITNIRVRFSCVHCGFEASMAINVDELIEGIFN